jgi:Asp-tRNA(Asn)/Glu-tRNA(Gln) amidotransferase B subunit
MLCATRLKLHCGCWADVQSNGNTLNTCYDVEGTPRDLYNTILQPAVGLKKGCDAMRMQSKGYMCLLQCKI